MHVDTGSPSDPSGAAVRSMVANDASTVLRISRTELDRLDPPLALLLHRIIGRALAEKVVVANRMTDQVEN